jgi:hypothetical protein
MRMSIALVLCGCVATPYVGPDGNMETDGSTQQPDAGGCFGNNDGVIAKSELQLAVGLSVDYLVQSGSQTAPIAAQPAGTTSGGVTTWDFSGVSGNRTKLALTPPSGWYASYFPQASYVTTTYLADGTLGAFGVSDNAVLLYGFASPDPNKTVLPYQQPVTVLELPIVYGMRYQSQGTVTNGTFNGTPWAEIDTYVVAVDTTGTLLLGFLRLDHTLRIRTDLTQQLPGGLVQTQIQYGYWHECFGEVARVTSLFDETDPNFTRASEVRVIAPP